MPQALSRTRLAYYPEDMALRTLATQLQEAGCQHWGGPEEGGEGGGTGGALEGGAPG